MRLGWRNAGGDYDWKVAQGGFVSWSKHWLLGHEQFAKTTVYAYDFSLCVISQ